MKLELQDVSVAYGDRTVVEGVGFTLEPGAIGCLLGLAVFKKAPELGLD